MIPGTYTAGEGIIVAFIVAFAVASHLPVSGPGSRPPHVVSLPIWTQWQRGVRVTISTRKTRDCQCIVDNCQLGDISAKVTGLRGCRHHRFTEPRLDM